MIGIIVAAGMGARMGARGKAMPKCLLPIAGRSLLDRTVENMQAVGCEKIVVVTGHLAEMIEHPDVTTVHNGDYPDNNILCSLMHARQFLDGPVLVSYSDIWVEPRIHRQLADTPGDIVLAVDRDWQPYYENRSDHPVGEAENVYVRSDNSVAEIGKHLGGDAAAEMRCGEFLGLWRMSARGAALFRDSFDKLDAQLNPRAPFEQAREWRKAYITDMMQFLIKQGSRIDCAVIARGWAELDTVQDYERLADIAARQCLDTIISVGE
ncbi:MAG: phosphocholine cytidylyltransferase family protein [Rhodospirillaceae bacterium]|nr:phosphocholine cytidylyltransferase family protein [Rhodospirillaceae bacterium]MBT4427194.1 phosphocholine cytidylyltransferase family protein [Rhodospirillaceae bacterium]MBT5037379.1 phosphocholine cytidylyltransferase family protein [Rhodospirillaceae bacterium]MBT5677354.1 phosphocholine cytidylyltransferase family protein [Rhodospirillaceae bacterium]MBT5779794.1 phosphocholine cytidylyltransferase family protein [Rhodospirillaceae bacterium]